MMLAVDHWSSFSPFNRALLQKSKTILSRSYRFKTSGTMLSSPHAFPSFILDFVFLYSSNLNGTVPMFRSGWTGSISSSAFANVGGFSKTVLPFLISELVPKVSFP